MIGLENTSDITSKRDCVMQTYTNIISQLTESQKIRLLTDFNSLIDPEMAQMGLPSVQSEHLFERMSGRFGAPEVLARSWDRQLIAEVSAAVCRYLARMGVGHVILPTARAAIGDVDTALSEDPYLSSLLALSYSEGADSARMPASLSGYGTRQGKTVTCKGNYKIVWRDRELCERTLQEHLVLPFERVMENGGCASVVVDAGDVLNEKLKKTTYINDEGEECEREATVLRTNVSDADTVPAINRGDIVLSGSAATLQGAVHNYRRLKCAIEHGQATSFDLEDAVASGEAVSEETVNEALCRLLDFAFSHAKESPDALTPEPKNLNLRAMRESTVLLTNNGVLPLGAPTKDTCTSLR